MVLGRFNSFLTLVSTVVYNIFLVFLEVTNMKLNYIFASLLLLFVLCQVELKISFLQISLLLNRFIGLTPSPPHLHEHTKYRN